MVVTNQEPLAERIRLLRSHGMTTLTYDRFKGHQSRYDVVGLGYNYRIDDIRSAIGLVQLDKLLPARGARRSILSRYADALAGRLLVPFAARIGREDAAYHLAPVVAGSEQQRDALMAHLRSRGIQTSVHYPPAHLFDYYRRRPGGEALPVTERVAASLVTLPLFAAMSSRQVDLVIQGVLDFLG
jgi:dTDP-4-amino-4,6-dideoxygalactose transaminase